MEILHIPARFVAQGYYTTIKIQSKIFISTDVKMDCAVKSAIFVHTTHAETIYAWKKTSE